MRSISGLILVGCLLLLGCNQQEDTSVVEARKRIHEFQASLKVWGPTVRPSDGIASTIGGWISCVSNANHRTELALELSHLFLSVSLTNQPYQAIRLNERYYSPYESAVSSYVDYLTAICWIMKENGCSSEEIMDFYFEAFSKYRNACFGVPLGLKRLPGESREACYARCSCARAAYVYYEHTMSYIRRFVIQEPSRYLPFPPELHKEFERRIKPFFKFPDKDDFMTMIHTGAKCQPAAKLSAPRDIPDVEVEIPGEEATKER